jgi:hypothetical protein
MVKRLDRRLKCPVPLAQATGAHSPHPQLNPGTPCILSQTWDWPLTLRPMSCKALPLPSPPADQVVGDLQEWHPAGLQPRVSKNMAFRGTTPPPGCLCTCSQQRTPAIELQDLGLLRSGKTACSKEGEKLGNRARSLPQDSPRVGSWGVIISVQPTPEIEAPSWIGSNQSTASSRVPCPSKTGAKEGGCLDKSAQTPKSLEARPQPLPRIPLSWLATLRFAGKPRRTIRQPAQKHPLPTKRSRSGELIRLPRRTPGANYPNLPRARQKPTLSPSKSGDT